MQERTQILPISGARPADPIAPPDLAPRFTWNLAPYIGTTLFNPENPLDINGGLSLKAVSYTHLDGQARQKMPAAPRRHHDPVERGTDTLRGKHIAGDRHPAKRILPVSYTHLDVYKRQMPAVKPSVTG